MPRMIRERWNDRDEAWLAPLGTYDAKRRRRRYVSLRYEDGRKVPHDDVAGAKAAVARIMAREKEEAARLAGPTVGDVIFAYLKWHREQGSSPNTLAWHKTYLTKFAGFEGYEARPAADIGLRDLSRVRKAMEKAGGDPSYIRHLYLCVRACWTWAARPIEDREPERLLPGGNPFAGIIVPGAGSPADKFVQPRVLRELLAFAGHRHASVHVNGQPHDRRYLLALKLIVLAGCRPSEAAGLRWDEIDWGERVIVIPAKRHRQALGRVHKTGKRTGKARRIDVRPELLEELRQSHGWADTHPTWVVAVKDLPPSWRPTARRLGIWFKALREDAIAAGIGLPAACTLYWFRHTWQTLGLAVGSAEEVALAAGNSPQVLMSTYASPQNRQVRSIGDRVAALIDGEGTD